MPLISPDRAKLPGAPSYERALRGFGEPSPAMASTLLRWIARTWEVDGDYRAAADCAEAALAAAEQSGDRAALGHALDLLAAARWRLGDHTLAERLFHRRSKVERAAVIPGFASTS